MVPPVCILCIQIFNTKENWSSIYNYLCYTLWRTQWIDPFQINHNLLIQTVSACSHILELQQHHLFKNRCGIRLSNEHLFFFYSFPQKQHQAVLTGNDMENNQFIFNNWHLNRRWCSCLRTLTCKNRNFAHWAEELLHSYTLRTGSVKCFLLIRPAIPSHT